MVGYYNQDIPSGELENNSNQKKYTINRSPKGDCIISRPVCALMVIGAILLAVLAGLLVFLFVPRCTGQETPAAIVQREKEKLDMIDESLPKDVLPMHYRIQLIPNLFSEPPLTNGAVSILLNVTEDTDRVVFHAKDLNIDKSSIVLTRIVDDKSVKIAGQNYNKDNQKYTIVFDETLKKNETYNLDVKFVGKINDQMQGFYRSRYEDGGKKEVMVSTQFSPTDARRAFPCFDEPSFKAKFTISIARPTNMTSLSNMPVRDKGQINIDKSDTVWDTYEETPLMSTYLVAFVVSNLSPFKYNSSEKLFTIWSRRDFLEQTRYGLDTVTKLLQYYENYFNINFPLPKIDIVAVPDFGYSAMENWGLITFREKVLLIDERSATLYDKRETAYVMAHELAHQWFGNLVTPRWWNDLWLKEGFATYLGYLGVHQIEPTWHTIDEFVYDHTYEAFKTDSLASSRPVSNDVHNNVQIRQQFDAISYSKGASLIRMLNHFLGNTRFKQGLINYLNRYRYSNADRDDLWNSFTLQEGDGGLPKNVSLSDVMGTWLLQPGFPVIFASGNVTNQSITIRQRRFLLVSENRTETWWVPVSASSDLDPSLTETTPKLWLGNSTEPIAFSQRFRNWYLLNMLQTGYYIVNYDERNWGALTSNIMSFNPPIRAQLISDSMDLARANLLSYSIPLQLIAEMTRADVNINDYLPFLTAFDKLEFLHDILYTTSTFEDFNIFMQRVFNHAFDNARLDTILPKNYVRERIQRIVLYWACKSPESSCTTDARFAYRRWMTEKQQVNPNIREVVYCTAIREGNEADWTFAYKMYFQTKVTAEKELLLKSLGCSNKPWVLSKFLDFTLSNATGVRKQDGALIFQSVASNPAGHQLAFNFLRNNWNALRKQYGDGFKILSRMVEALPKYMNTQYFLDELKSFQMKNLNNLGSAEQALDRCIEIVKANVEWTRQNLKILDDLLKDFNRRFLS